jgi:ceramide glucosyltransferase
VFLTGIAAALAVLSAGLTLWQWRVARRFPLHQRIRQSGPAPGVTLLKPLKGRDDQTEACLRSWFEQQYAGPAQILCGVASKDDPVCALAAELGAAHPNVNAQLIVCPRQLGSNAKVSTLVQLEARAAHEIVVISDADVFAPPDLLTNAVFPLRDPAVGLVNCFYELANPVTTAMRLEAVAVNADFWSQVLQAQSIKPLSFALGAVMVTTRAQLEKIGGLAALVDFLADDYQLGRKMAERGARIVLCPVVVECRSPSAGWQAVWQHQLRWARTIRVCQPAPFFFSVLSNGTIWPLLWLALDRTPASLAGALLFCGLRVLTARTHQQRLTRRRLPWTRFWLAPLKDLAAVVIWALAFLGNRVEWRGQHYRMRPDGRLDRVIIPKLGEPEPNPKPDFRNPT